MSKMHLSTHAEAVRRAQRFARNGPRVAAVLKAGKKFAAVPGFMDADSPTLAQVLLVTPDGRCWKYDPKNGR